MSKLNIHCTHCMKLVNEPTAMQNFGLVPWHCTHCGKSLQQRYTLEEFLTRLDQRLEAIEIKTAGKPARQVISAAAHKESLRENFDDLC